MPSPTETPFVLSAVNRETGQTSILYEPTEKQRAFHLTPAKNKLYGGAAGGGKSHAIRWDAYIACLSVPKLRCLLLRRTFPELNDTHIERAVVEQHPLGAEYIKTEYKMRFDNGAVLQFGHCQDDNALARYLSTEYDRIYFDELVTFTEKQWLMIGSRARTTKPGVIPQIVAATNPGGPGAHWIKRRFIDKNITLDEDPTYHPDDYAYIKATLDDNPYVDPSYEQRLLALPDDLRRAYRYGDWNLFPGQFFKEWRTDQHVVDLDAVVPSWCERFLALHWGYNRPGCILWLACLPDGRLYVEQEWHFRGTVAKEVAAALKVRNMGLTIRYVTASPDLWIPDGQTGEDTAETFARAGVPLIRAEHEPEVGWQRLRHWLRPAPDGRPWLVVSSRCPFTTRSVPSLTMHERHPEDISDEGEPQAAHALRYAVMSRPVPSAEAKASTFPVNSVGWLKQLASQPVVIGSRAVRRR